MNDVIELKGYFGRLNRYGVDISSNANKKEWAINNECLSSLIKSQENIKKFMNNYGINYLALVNKKPETITEIKIKDDALSIKTNTYDTFINKHPEYTEKIVIKYGMR